MTKRKKDYRGYQPSRRGPAPAAEVPAERPTLVTINSEAAIGRPGFRVGDHVRIESSGAYSGESAVIERLTGGPIPAAAVRTESGRSRQVRTIDLVLLAERPSPPDR
jgi:hypothetical protein